MFWQIFLLLVAGQASASEPLSGFVVRLNRIKANIAAAANEAGKTADEAQATAKGIRKRGYF